MATELLSDPLSLTLLLLLGGWTALDGTSVGQFMVSRPLVAATLAGWVVGDPLAGLTVGVVLEAFQLSVLPVGAARYPESGPPAVVSGAMFATSSQLPSALLVALAFALGWEWIGGVSIRLLRQVNVRIAAVKQGQASALQLRHLASVTLDFGRGVLLCALGIVVLAAVMEPTQAQWAIGQRIPLAVTGAALAGMLATAPRLLPGRLRLFVAGAVAGLVFVLLRP